VRDIRHTGNIRTITKVTAEKGIELDLKVRDIMKRTKWMGHSK
jgi:hypothetical protein